MAFLRTMAAALLVVLAVAQQGCGGGGGAGQPAGGTNTVPLPISVSNLPAGVSLGALKVTLGLPPGIWVAADASGEVAAGTVAPTGSAAGGVALVVGNYQASSNTLVVGLISAVGFGAGDVAVVRVNAASGTAVSPAAVSVQVDEVRDVSTNGAVPGVIVTVH